jgi:hypothetical protein
MDQGMEAQHELHFTIRRFQRREIGANLLFQQFHRTSENVKRVFQVAHFGFDTRAFNECNNQSKRSEKSTHGMFNKSKKY